MDCTACSVCCSALWIGFRLGRSSARRGTYFLQLSIASDVCRVCAIRDCDYVLVRWHKAGHTGSVLASVVRSYLFEPSLNTVSRALYDLVFLIFALLMTVVTRARDELEVRVAERTAELTRANEELRLEIAERKQAEYLIGSVRDLTDGIAILTRLQFQRVIRRTNMIGK